MPVTRFYKKGSPKTGVYLSNGSSLRFEQINPVTGVFTTDDATIQREFAQCMQENRGGISEISEEEYQALLKKKATPFQAPWRNDLRAAMQSHGAKILQRPVARVEPAATKPAPAPQSPPRTFAVSNFRPVARPRNV